jgi:hypothetical protein
VEINENVGVDLTVMPTLRDDGLVRLDVDVMRAFLETLDSRTGRKRTSFDGDSVTWWSFSTTDATVVGLFREWKLNPKLQLDQQFLA